MRRREFIAGLGGVVAWPLAGRAQQQPMPVIGYLDSSPIDPSSLFISGFRRGLSEAGYVEGRNVAIEYRSGLEQYGRLPALAEDLVQHRVAVIAATGVSLSALAAKGATTTIPVVFWLGGDPVSLGLVSSFNKPGGNVTGVSTLTNQLSAKRLELFRRLLPNSAKTAVLVNPNNPNVEADLSAIRDAARALAVELIVLPASTEREIDAAVAKLIEQSATALFVAADQFLTDRRNQLAALAERYAIPFCGPGRPWVVAGALMSYGDDRTETSRQFGIYVGRILKGDKPADLPVMQPTKFELVINLKTAKALGLTIPETLLATADEVIQ